jgi:Putative peptidoglycan binding domain
MRTFLVLICTVALACVAGGAQEKNKSKKQAPKKNQIQSTQHAAAKAGGTQKNKGPQHVNTVGRHSANVGGQKTKEKAKGSQYIAEPGAYSGTSRAQKTKEKTKGSQQIATQTVGGGRQKTKGSQQVVAAGKYTGSSAYSKKTKQSKVTATSAAGFQSSSKTYKAHQFKLETNPRPATVAGVTFQQNRRIQGSQNWNGENYWAFRNYRPVWHDRVWWNSHYNRVVFVYGGWYYWNAGWWYPAWGYAPNAYYAYDGPIYGYNGLPPDQVIANVQAALQQQGYYDGRVDGLLGPLTRAAIAGYQRDRGLYITSAIDRPTLRSLGMT